ncbi:hypothetical protein C0J52_24882 [Blattella germanica]|nr:hypothetical protein C0J52_24882 [Blattella germanica]
MDFVQRTSLNDTIEAEVQYTEMLIKEEVKAFDLQEPAIDGEERAEPVCVTVKHELEVKEQPVETEGNESKCDWKQAHYEIKDEREDVTEQHSMLKPEIVMANECDDQTVEDEAENGVLETQQGGNRINSDDKDKSEASKVNGRIPAILVIKLSMTRVT